jgi:hypothetical protein
VTKVLRPPDGGVRFPDFLLMSGSRSFGGQVMDLSYGRDEKAGMPDRGFLLTFGALMISTLTAYSFTTIATHPPARLQRVGVRDLR